MQGTDLCVCVCDIATSKTKWPRPVFGLSATEKRGLRTRNIYSPVPIFWILSYVLMNL